MPTVVHGDFEWDGANAAITMKKPNEPSAASLEEMPEIAEPRFQRRPGLGHHAGRSVGEIIAIDPSSGCTSTPPMPSTTRSGT
jgi:hypothetical protein